MPENIIQTDGLTFFYSKDRKALDNVSLNIPKGAIYGFLGPNGAGKSTTVKILCGLISDFSGQVTIKGYDIRQNPLAVKSSTTKGPNRNGLVSEACRRRCRTAND